MRTDLVITEALQAQKRYGPFRSTHEAYGVLCEEVSELLFAIRENNIDSIRHEAMQVASVALRLANEDDVEFLARSVK